MRETVGKVIKHSRDAVGLTPHESKYVQLIRSLVVSVISLVFDFSTLVILKEVMGINYLVAAVLGFLVGVTVNYFLSVTWVFTNRKLTSRKAEIVVFVVICTIGLLLNLLIIAIAVEGIQMDYRIAKIIATVIVFFWNFIARKKILY